MAYPVLVEEEKVETQLTSNDVGRVGHCDRGSQMVRCSRSTVIGRLGIEAATESVAHTRPSRVYLIKRGVQMTPHVCHCVRLTLRKLCVWWLAIVQ